METKQEYLKHRILEQGWIKSATIPEASIHVCCREGCDDYSNIYVSYLTNEKEIYFRLTKQLPSLEQMKELIVFDEVSDEEVKEIHDFITSKDIHTDNALFYEVTFLLKAMEYEKIPREQYRKMNKDSTLKDFIKLLSLD